MPPFSAIAEGTMKRKYGSALQRESLAEKMMREAASQMHDNSHNYGSTSRKGAISRGKVRSRAQRRTAK
jgi:hypothetical protein